jgi:hypothetical protein
MAMRDMELTDKYLRKIIRTLKKSAAKHRGDTRPGRRRLAFINICVTCIRSILTFALSELRGRQRGELQNYLNCQFRESRTQFES